MHPIDAYVVASETRYFISAQAVVLANSALPFIGLCSFDDGEQTLTCVVDQITARRTKGIEDPNAFDITIEAIRSAGA